MNLLEKAKKYGFVELVAAIERADKACNDYKELTFYQEAHVLDAALETERMDREELEELVDYRE